MQVHCHFCARQDHPTLECSILLQLNLLRIVAYPRKYIGYKLLIFTDLQVVLHYEKLWTFQFMCYLNITPPTHTHQRDKFYFVS